MTKKLRSASFRAFLLGAGLGALLCLLQVPLITVILPLLGAESGVLALGREYVEIRI